MSAIGKVNLNDCTIVISDDDDSDRKPKIVRPRDVRRKAPVKYDMDSNDEHSEGDGARAKKSGTKPGSPRVAKRKYGIHRDELDSDYEPTEPKPRDKRLKTGDEIGNPGEVPTSRPKPKPRKATEVKIPRAKKTKIVSPAKEKASKKVAKPKTPGVKRKTPAPKPRKKTNTGSDTWTPGSSGSGSGWDIVEEVATLTDTPLDITINVAKLLDSENTIPFIARYRKEMTDNMEAPKLRQLEEAYETLKTVKIKTQTVIQTVEKMGKMTDNLLKALETTKSLDEIDHLYMPFKLGRKTLAEKARSRGLETPAMALLQNPRLSINLHQYMDPSNKDLQTVEQVSQGIYHILSEIFSKDYDVIKEVQKLFPTSNMTVECKMNRNYAKKANEGDTKGYKFELYYDFRNQASRLRSHQILAINRGENLKILSVKVRPDKFAVHALQEFIFRQFFHDKLNVHHSSSSLVMDSIQYCYNKSIEPLIERRVRSELTKSAEKESVTVFATNLSNLLLTQPLHGKVVMAVDPGYTHGSKLAVVNETGNILHTETLMLLDRKHGEYEVGKFVEIVQAFRCQVIAIGNGSGCRDVEAVVSNLIAKDAFQSRHVSYCIVNESGVSIYSCSDLAAEELPFLEANLRSAVSLARRLIDPLSEYIKVEPRHLGVGMYQHDISENVLKKTLDNVVEECISFTGIDINICSEIALSKIAGIKGKMPRAIVEWRKSNGGFINREQIRLVNGIGPVTYEQCAGFLRISPITLDMCKRLHVKESGTAPCQPKKKAVKIENSMNMLDRTIIHPESYGTAHLIIKLAGLSPTDIGKQHFIKTMETFLTQSRLENLSQELSVGLPTIKLISEGFRKSLDYDIREEFSKPLFKQQLRTMSSLEIGTILSGKVMNVTTFGAFVDVGVDRDGLIPSSKMDRNILSGRVLGVGDCVEARVISVDLQKNKLAMSLHAISDRPKVVLH